MLELLAGVLVAGAALALVLEPLVRWVPAAASSLEEIDFTSIEESESPKIQALLALKEIEFDRATGKLSDEDYALLKGKYSKLALAAIKHEDATEVETSASSPDVDPADPAERVVAALKAKRSKTCPVCGPRPEAAAVFCSSCGRSLLTPDSLPRCWKCGATVTEGARFCGTCGGEIAA